MPMKCSKCNSKSDVRAGFFNGKQRYKCKECGCHFAASTRKRGRSAGVFKAGIEHMIVAKVLPNGQIAIPADMRRC